MSDGMQYGALAQAMMRHRNQASPMGQQQAGMPDPGMMGSLGYTGQNQPPGQTFGMGQGNPREKTMPTMGIGPRLPTQGMMPNMGIPTRQPLSKPMNIGMSQPDWAVR